MKASPTCPFTDLFRFFETAARTQDGAALPELGAGWEKALAEEADGYAVSVWVEALDVR
jgi:hypothetical protein